MKFLEHLSKFTFWNTWVDSIRPGPTGVGYTLETLLEIPENNSKEADLHGVEIKAHRSNTTSLVTLFTCSPSTPQKRYGHFLIDSFGYDDGEGNRRFYGWSPDQVSVTANSTCIACLKEESPLVMWNSDKIEKRLTQKLKTVALVDADVRVEAGIEQFRYTGLTMYSGTSYIKFGEAVNSKDVVIDFRMKKNEHNRLRDHGTAFRTKGSGIEHLYETKTLIDLNRM